VGTLAGTVRFVAGTPVFLVWKVDVADHVAVLFVLGQPFGVAVQPIPETAHGNERGGNSNERGGTESARNNSKFMMAIPFT
jgi:hypothetical protein